MAWNDNEHDPSESLGGGFDSWGGSDAGPGFEPSAVPPSLTGDIGLLGSELPGYNFGAFSNVGTVGGGAANPNWVFNPTDPNAQAGWVYTPSYGMTAQQYQNAIGISGTFGPWGPNNADWSKFNLKDTVMAFVRFAGAQVPIVNPVEVAEAIIADINSGKSISQAFQDRITGIPAAIVEKIETALGTGGPEGRPPAGANAAFKSFPSLVADLKAAGVPMTDVPPNVGPGGQVNPPGGEPVPHSGTQPRTFSQFGPGPQTAAQAAQQPGGQRPQQWNWNPSTGQWNSSQPPAGTGLPVTGGSGGNVMGGSFNQTLAGGAGPGTGGVPILPVNAPRQFAGTAGGDPINALVDAQVRWMERADAAMAQFQLYLGDVVGRQAPGMEADFDKVFRDAMTAAGTATAQETDLATQAREALAGGFNLTPAQESLIRQTAEKTKEAALGTLQEQQRQAFQTITDVTIPARGLRPIATPAYGPQGRATFPDTPTFDAMGRAAEPYAREAGRIISTIDAAALGQMLDYPRQQGTALTQALAQQQQLAQAARGQQFDLATRAMQNRLLGMQTTGGLLGAAAGMAPNLSGTTGALIGQQTAQAQLGQQASQFQQQFEANQPTFFDRLSQGLYAGGAAMLGIGALGSFFQPKTPTPAPIR